MTDEQYLKELGKRIYTLRVQNELNQEELAEKLNITRMHLYRIEKGKSPTTIIGLRHIAKELGVELGQLVEF